jgi:hypothetical protein
MGVFNLVIVPSPSCSASFHCCEMWESRQISISLISLQYYQYGIDNILCHSFFNTYVQATLCGLYLIWKK